MSFETEQEEFWASDFGNTYIGRNKDFITNIPFFSEVIKRTTDVASAIEFGCNIGLNLQALKVLLPDIELTGVEINESACKYLNEWKGCRVINKSIFDYDESTKYDLSIIKGVLIHINPDKLDHVYETIYRSSKKYILIAEYYSPTPVTLDYRGHSERLFKRDFAGEMLDKYKKLDLIDYGFLYHRDNYFAQDDINWFLIEKKN
jgi:pseudaminic acid biosynthesis-associated methylase